LDAPHTDVTKTIMLVCEKKPSMLICPCSGGGRAESAETLATEHESLRTEAVWAGEVTAESPLHIPDDWDKGVVISDTDSDAGVGENACGRGPDQADSVGARPRSVQSRFTPQQQSPRAWRELLLLAWKAPTCGGSICSEPLSCMTTRSAPNV
jgi:hypothetical protein